MPTNTNDLLVSADTAANAAANYSGNQQWQEDLATGLDFFEKSVEVLEKSGKIKNLPNAPTAGQFAAEGAAFIGATTACIVGIVGSAAAGAGAPVAVAGCSAAVTSFIKLFGSIKKLKAYWVARDNRNESISMKNPVFTYVCQNGKQDFQNGAVNCANANGRFNDIVFIQNSGWWNAFLAYAWTTYLDSQKIPTFEAQLHQLGNSQPLGGQAWTLIRDRQPTISANWAIPPADFQKLVEFPIKMTTSSGGNRSWASFLGAFDFARWEWLQMNDTEKSKYLTLYQAFMVLGGFDWNCEKSEIDTRIGQAAKVAMAKNEIAKSESENENENTWYYVGGGLILLIILYFLFKK